jgi:tRNA (adenine37-N6)-methyltransferase
MMEELCVRSIGVIRSPIKKADDAPKQGSEAGVKGQLIVAEQYRDALEGLSSGQRIVILYWMHLAARDRLRVHPRGDHSRPLKGVFATRSPHRPNPIAVDVVDILEIQGTTLTVRGLDAMDNTPLLDIKCEL